MKVKKNNNGLIWTIIITVIIIVAGLVYYFDSSKDGKGNTDQQLTEIVQNQNTDEFLKLFDDKTTKSSLSSIGAKSILNDWNQNSSVDITKLGTELKNNHKVPGADNDYRIQLQEPKKWEFYKKTKLTTMTSKVIIPPKLKKATIKVDGLSVSINELKNNNLFPGIYNFRIKLNGNTLKQKLYILGDGRSVTLKVPKAKSTIKEDSTVKEPTTENDNSTTSSKHREYDPYDASVVNNDPTYVDADSLTVGDIQGKWLITDSKTYSDMPYEIDIVGNELTITSSENSDTYEIMSSEYSDDDGTMVFMGDNMTFPVKLVRVKAAGDPRVVMEYENQGSSPTYFRR